MGRSTSVQPWVGVVAALVLVATSCSEPEPENASPDVTSAAPSDTGDGTVLSLYQGSEWYLGDIPEAVAADDSLEPVLIGFMNTDEAPVAAMPELHQATDAAVAFINAELGGIDGHPIELVPCQTDLSAESAKACARKMVAEDVIAVLPGISIGSGAAVAVLEENGIPWIGGIPLNEDEMTSDVSFQFSGGSPAAFSAFADHADGPVANVDSSIWKPNNEFNFGGLYHLGNNLSRCSHLSKRAS